MLGQPLQVGALGTFGSERVVFFREASSGGCWAWHRRFSGLGVRDWSVAGGALPPPAFLLAVLETLPRPPRCSCAACMPFSGLLCMVPAPWLRPGLNRLAHFLALETFDHSGTVMRSTIYFVMYYSFASPR